MLAELDPDDDYALDDELLALHHEMASPTLYATMPTREWFERWHGLWRAYQRGDRPEDGHAPRIGLFAMLDDLRAWGPEDRFSAQARAELEDRLAEDEAAEIRLELEVWPTQSRERRERWRGEAERRVAALGGRVLSRSSIEEQGFIYEALLVVLSAGSVRELIAHPDAVEGLATLDGLQFVLPQVIAQSLPNQSEPLSAPGADGAAAFDSETPLRAVLLDGAPVAGHRSLDDGAVIEDVHALVGRSVVAHRRHATSMASLILRGDLTADGVPVEDSRLLYMPVLVDAEGHASSPGDRLFVDVVHVALTRALAGAEPLAPEASPAISTAHGPGPFGAIKPDLPAVGGRHDVRTVAAGDNLRLRVVRETGRSGVFVAAARAGVGRFGTRARC